MSTHSVRVVRLGPITPHPNADTLGVTKIDGYTVIVRTSDWREGDFGVYVEPDYVVPEAPWSEFLKGHRRIKVRKLRGIYSQGLLLPLADVSLSGSSEGDDVMAALGIIRWQPPEAHGDDAPPPVCAEGLASYDVENWRKFRHLIPTDEPTVVTEKLHGESARFVFDEERMHAGSRTRWKKLESSTSWAVALRSCQWIEAWCRAHPRDILYGEVFGNVPKMAYGVRPGDRSFLAFDVWSEGRWLDWDEFCAVVPVQHRVPVIAECMHGDVTEALAEGVSTLAPHVREGIVVKTRRETVLRSDEEEFLRGALKCIGNGYYEKSD